MLRDGQFLKEAPIQVGAHYVPAAKPRYQSAEERFMQAVLLGDAKSVSIWSVLVGKLMQI